MIPSGAPDARAAGTHLANMRRQARGGPTEIRLRFPPCCDEHKQALKSVHDVIDEGSLASYAKRLADHYGHLGLRPKDATLEWLSADGREPCADCLSEAEQREAKAKQAGRVA
jgi:hypothetical protein